MLVDKIVAVVGDKIILKAILKIAWPICEGRVWNFPDAKCLTLQQMMGVKALVLQAEKDSLPITDEEIDAELDNRIRYYISAYGTKDELERVAIKSIYQLKDQRTGIRDQKLASAMRDKVVGHIKITPNETRKYFESIPTDSLPYYETEVELGQIVVYPKASREAEWVFRR